MFEAIFAFLDEAVTKNIANTIGSLADVVSPLMGACVGLYFVFLSYKLVFDSHKDVFQEYINTTVSLAVCTFIAFNTAWFQANVVPGVLYMGDDIANTLLGTNTATGASSLQSIYDSVMAQNKLIWDGLDFSFVSGEAWLNLFLTGSLIIVSFLGFLPFIAISTAYLLVAKVMVSFLLILAPVYVMFAFFPSTRDMFKSWIGQALNYILLSVVYPLAFNLFKQLLETTGMSGNITAASIMMTFIIMFALIILATQIPTFTSALTGGIGINGLVGGIGATAGSAANVMNPLVNNPATRAGAKHVGGKIANAYNRLRGRGGISAG